MVNPSQYKTITCREAQTTHHAVKTRRIFVIDKGVFAKERLLKQFEQPVCFSFFYLVSLCVGEPDIGVRVIGFIYTGV